jgi:hypothetical protein
MLQFAKRLVFGRGAAPHTIWFGAGAGCRFVIDPADQTQRILGLAEAEVAPLFRRAAGRARTLIDVGASDGYYPIVGLRLNPSLTAIGCDAHPDHSVRARENYRLTFGDSGPTMEWVCCRIGDAEGEVTLDLLAADRPGPVLVKIDVDGGEVGVLRGGARVLDRSDCTVILEVHSAELEAECLAILKAHGFDCRIINPAWWRRIVPEHRPIPLNRWVLAQKPAAPA